MTEPLNSTALQAVSNGNFQFTFHLYSEISRNQENIFFSPIGVHFILAMAYLGAIGKTAKEMSHALHLPNNYEIVEHGFKDVMNHFKNPNDITLKIANKIYVSAQTPINEKFQQKVDKLLFETELLDLSKSSEVNRESINEWVETKTDRKIKNFLPPGALDDISLLLLNAIYFKAKWNYPFNENSTKMEPFHVSKTRTKDVEIMHIANTFLYGYSEELDCQILQLPYKDKWFNFIVLLPKHQDGIFKMEKKLPSVNLSTLLKSLRMKEVIVSIPKFKLEHGVNLNHALQAMGMTEAFDKERADFRGLSDVGLAISDVLHKSYIEVNEEGSEVASTVGVMMSARSMPPPPVRFEANRPFLFLILNSKLDVILFAGRILEP